MRILTLCVLDWIEKRNHVLLVLVIKSMRRVICRKRPLNNLVLCAQFLEDLMMSLTVTLAVKESSKFRHQEVLIEDDANVPLPSWKQWECITAGLYYQIAG